MSTLPSLPGLLKGVESGSSVASQPSVLFQQKIDLNKIARLAIVYGEDHAISGRDVATYVTNGYFVMAIIAFKRDCDGQTKKSAAYEFATIMVKLSVP